MIERQKTLQLNQINHDYSVTMLYDKCKTGESQYGPWALFSVEFDGVSQGLFADQQLHAELAKFGRGSKLIIRRNQEADGKLEWQVTPANGNSQPKSNKTVSSYLDDRTRDIHRQVALKIATISIGQNVKPWTDEDLKEIRVRMDKLLEILDGSTKDDLPF